MSSYFPKMKIIARPRGEVDDMYSVHAHAGNLSRAVIVECLRGIISSRSTYQATHPVSFADFGTADGRASLSLINEMIDIVQNDMGEEQAVVVYYNDQPMNDFNLLSKVIQGDGQDSRLKVRSNVYPVIVPRTMYEQCLPINSLDLAISSVATHYLSKQSCRIKQGIFINEADEYEARLIREQGKADWRAFVISRGRELKPGGFIVTMNESSDDENNVNDMSQVENRYRRMGSFLSDMAKEGVITQEEYLATNYHGHYLRTPADFKEPFTSALPEVGEIGLELVSVKSLKHYLKHPTFDIIDKGETEKLEYSRAIVASIYPWLHHSLYDGLSFSRTEEEKQMIIDQYFSRLQAYAFATSDYKPYLTYTEVVIKKCMHNEGL